MSRFGLGRHTVDWQDQSMKWHAHFAQEPLLHTCNRMAYRSLLLITGSNDDLTANTAATATRHL